jgi:hypothetical protein
VARPNGKEEGAQTAPDFSASDQENSSEFDQRRLNKFFESTAQYRFAPWMMRVFATSIWGAATFCFS